MEAIWNSLISKSPNLRFSPMSFSPKATQIVILHTLSYHQVRRDKIHHWLLSFSKHLPSDSLSYSLSLELHTHFRCMKEIKEIKSSWWDLKCTSQEYSVFQDFNQREKLVWNFIDLFSLIRSHNGHFLFSFHIGADSFNLSCIFPWTKAFV